ncbi:MAG: AAA family ATPase [Planctomycetota bacterium]
MSQSNLPVPMSHAAAPRAAASPDIVTAEPALTLFEILLRHKGKMIFCVAVLLSLGVLYQLTTDKVFQSTAEIFIEQSKDGQPNSPLSPGGLSSGLPSTHARLLESMPVLIKALETPAVAQSETMSKIEGEGPQLRHLKKKLSVGYSKESEVVTVSFMSTVPEDTKTVLDAVLAAYLAELQVEVGAVATVEAALPAEELARGVMDEEMVASRLMKLSEELTAAEVDLEAAQIRVAQAQQSGGNLASLSSLLAEAGLNAQVHGLAEIAYLKAELARLDQQLEGMPTNWAPEHKVRGPVQRQADALRYEIANLTQNAQTTMLGLIQSNQKNAAERVAELNRRITTQQSRASQIAQLPVDIYQQPFVPTKKIAPKGIKTLGISLVLGLGIGLMWTLWTEMKRPASAAALAALAAEGQAPALASQARSVQDTTDQAAAPRRALPFLMNGEDMSASSDNREAPPMLGLVPEVPAGSRLTSPNFDATASSIHQIRAVLQVQARSQDTKAYAFTSPRRGAGKTSVTIGVASSLAMSGTRTLVVDCDLAGRISRGQTGAPAEQTNGSPANGHVVGDRFGPIDPEGSSGDNPTLDNIVIEQGYISEDDTQSLATNATGQMGITGVLDGADLQACVVKATVPGLWLLPAIHAQTRHIGKMSDAFIRDVIQQAAGHYDLVLFDTGPIPGSVEALLVTSQADGVVVVVPQGESRQALDRTMSYLKVVGAKVTGTVFNRVANTTDKAPSSPKNSSVGGAVAAAAAAGETHRHGEPTNGDMLVELEKQQQATDEDGEYLSGDAPLGSGILAAAVFSDADSEYESQDWKLEGTSEFNGSVDELFGSVNGEKNNGQPKTNGEAKTNGESNGQA